MANLPHPLNGEPEADRQAGRPSIQNLERPLITRLFRYFRPSRPAVAQRFAGAAMGPGRPIAVVGDIHGRLDCLEEMLGKLTAHSSKAAWIFAGDYIDRGDHSAQIIDRLFHLTRDRPDTTCLLGNHEEMLLWFLDDPVNHGPSWLRHGGLQSLASFGISAPQGVSDPQQLVAIRDQLVTTLPTAQLDWLRTLPRYWQGGYIAVVHAGADPRVPLNQQSAQALTWGHKAFKQIPRQDGVWVIHGHTPVKNPIERNGVISIDTGAFATGKLSAALVEDGSVSYLQTTTIG